MREVEKEEDGKRDREREKWRKDEGERDREREMETGKRVTEREEKGEG